MPLIAPTPLATRPTSWRSLAHPAGAPPASARATYIECGASTTKADPTPPTSMSVGRRIEPTNDLGLDVCPSPRLVGCGTLDCVPGDQTQAQAGEGVDGDEYDERQRPPVGGEVEVRE